MTFLNGHTPWNKGNKGIHLSQKTEFKKGVAPWNKGLGKRPPVFCVECGKELLHKIRKVKRCLSCAQKYYRGNKIYKWKGGKPRCVECGKKLSRREYKVCYNCYIKSNYFKKSLKEKQMKGLLSQQNSKEPTSIEKKLYQELKDRGFLFETQKIINGKFVVDAYVPKFNLIIECDGIYWHSLDRVVKKDKAENAYLTKCGYNLLRLTETEINNYKFVKKLEFLEKGGD